MVEEFPYACDGFGYLTMAKQIREATAASHLPNFRFDSPQTQLLIAHLQSQNVPLASWDEMAAPHAHHYFPRAGYVGVQYPPGTGMLLALFPEGHAAHRLDFAVIALFCAIGAFALVFAAVRRAWLAAGFSTLGIHLGLDVIGRMSGLSFSVNAVLAALLLTFAFIFIALELKARDKMRGGSWAAAFIAGGCFGFAMLIRLDVIFLGPGLLVLLWPASWRKLFGDIAGAFGLGIAVCGVLPTIAYQQWFVGAWYLSAYNSRIVAYLGKNAPPKLDTLKHNVPFYLWAGDGSKDNWALALIVAGFAAAVWLRRVRGAHRLGFGWQRLAWAALVLCGVPLAYFLTHQLTTPYYLVLPILTTILLFAFGSLLLETPIEIAESVDSAQPLNLRALVLMLALLPGITVAARALTQSEPPAQAESLPRSFALPAELLDARAWVYADLLTGTIWYYTKKPAYKIQFSNPETRAMLYKFAFERGEPQYLIQDSAEMLNYIEEIKRLGGTLEPRGKVDGQPYFLIHWPEGGPVSEIAIKLSL